MKKELLSSIAVFLLAIMCIAAACIPEPSPPSITAAITPSNPAATPTSNPSTTLSVQELKLKIEKSDSFMLVDVRSRTDFETGHIDGAISIPLSEIPSRYGEVPQGPEVIVYAQCA